MKAVHLTLLVTIFSSGVAVAQSTTLEKELETRILAGYEAWNRADLDSIKGGQLGGFGFRTKAVRTHNNLADDVRRQRLEAWFDKMEHYEIEVEDLQVSVVSDIGLAWGFHVEDFQVKGRPPERIRVRFSGTYRRAEDGQWQKLFFHRDIQDFDENGRYLAHQNCQSGSDSN